MNQNVLKIDGFNKELELPYNNSIGFVIIEGEYRIVKLINFVSEENEEEKDEE